MVFSKLYDREQVVKAKPKTNSANRPLVFSVLASETENTPAEENKAKRPTKRPKGAEADTVTDNVLKDAQPQPLFPPFSVPALVLSGGEQYRICGAGFAGRAQDTSKLLVRLQ